MKPENQRPICLSKENQRPICLSQVNRYEQDENETGKSKVDLH